MNAWPVPKDGNQGARSNDDGKAWQRRGRQRRIAKDVGAGKKGRKEKEAGLSGEKRSSFCRANSNRARERWSQMEVPSADAFLI